MRAAVPLYREIALPLRPELASVCRFLAVKRAERVVRVVQTNGGVLSELAGGRGRQ